MNEYRTILLERDAILRIDDPGSSCGGSPGARTASVSLLPGVRDLLARFQREGYCLALTSPDDPGRTREQLEGAQISTAFDAIVALSPDARPKPEPDILRAALEETGTPPARAIAIGSTPDDLGAARAAGVASIALLSGGFPGFSLRGAIAVYRDPLDLLENFEMSPLSRSSSDPDGPRPFFEALAFMV
jgi:phosphoglycolate phosphatase-like HAD superfamily hydrolase